MTVSPIFKAYDIRGRTDIGEVTPEISRRLGVAVAGEVEESVVAVGRDCRLTSPDLFASLAVGLNAGGCDVLDLGEVPTEVVYQVSGERSVAGVMITASHNPPQYNGFKLCRSGAVPIGQDTGLGRIAEAISRPALPEPGGGTVSRIDAIPGYVKHLFAVVPPESISELRVAADGGNGMAGTVLPLIFEELSSSLTGLYLDPDGTFPNHPADPLQVENVAELISTVASGDFHLGVAFDGDADRAFFVDDLGVPLSGSSTTALIARWFLGNEPGAAVVHNLICSRAVPETIVAAGGRPVRTRVGHSFIKAVMAKTNAVFGGEHSGHYYFRANYRADSGMLAMLVLMRVLSESAQPLSELRKEVEPYHSSGEINFEVADTDDALDRVESAFSDFDIDLMDGLTVDLGPSWFNLRPSNTEPVVRLNVETPQPEITRDLVNKLSRLLEA